MSRKFLVVFLTLILLVTLCITPVSALTIPVLDFDGLPFGELPDLSNYQSYWLVKLEDETYSLVSTNGSFRVTVDGVTYQNMIRLTSSLKKSVYTSGTEWHTWLYDGVKWVDKGTNSNNYSSINLSGENSLIYCTVPVYDVDGNIYWPSDTVDDPSEPEDPTEEPTDPTEPPVVDDEDSIDKSWFDSLGETLLDGIKELFFPIELLQATESLLNAFNDLFDSFGEFDLSPITEFLDSLGSGNVTTYLMKIWDLPIVRELSLAIVLIALIGGLFKFLITV